MPDERQFKIRITTTADTAGAKETRNELNNLSPETRKYIESLKSQEQQTEKVEFASRRMVKALGSVSPELGQIAHVGHLIEAGGVAAAIFGIGEAIKIFNERVDGLMEALGGIALPDLDTKALATYAEHWNGIAEAVRKTIDAFDSVDEKSARVSKKIQETLKQQSDLDKANKDREIAALDAKKDELSSSDYAARKKEIEDRYAARGVAARQKSERDELAEQYRKQANLEISSQNKLIEADAIKVGPKAKEDAALAESAKAADAAREEQKKALDLQATIREASSGKQDWTTTKARAQLFGKGIDLNEPGWEEKWMAQAGQNFTNAQQVIDKYNLDQRAAAQHDKDRKRQQELRDQAAKEAGEAATLKKSLPQQSADLATSLANENAVAAAEAQARQSKFTEDVFSGKSGSNFKMAAQAENTLMHGGKLDATQAAVLNEITNLLRKQNQNADQILQWLAQAGNNQDELARRIASIDKRQLGSYTY